MKFQFYLHYAVPVVSRWHSEEQQECHAEVFECGIASETFAWVEFIANWWSEKQQGRCEEEEEWEKQQREQ